MTFCEVHHDSYLINPLRDTVKRRIVDRNKTYWLGATRFKQEYLLHDLSNLTLGISSDIRFHKNIKCLHANTFHFCKCGLSPYNLTDQDSISEYLKREDCNRVYQG